MIIRSRAPVRLSFAGGGTDVSPFTEQKGGAVLSTTINKYVYGTLVTRHDESVNLMSADYKISKVFYDVENMQYDGDLDLMKAIAKVMKPGHGFEIFLRSDIPPNTGVGSSGSVGVNLIGLFNHLREKKLNKHEISEVAYKTEIEELKNITGRQDAYAACFGGLNFIEFKGDDFVRVTPLKIKEDTLLELEKHLVLAYIGRRGESGEIQKVLKEQKDAYNEKEKIKSLDIKKQMAFDMKLALENGDLGKFAELMRKDWEEKKKLHKGYTNEKVDKLYELGIKHGAVSAKTTGAGVGGHMLFYCKDNKEHEVVSALEKEGVRVVDFSFEGGGLKTWEVNEKWKES
ncbi:GHMP kinase [archaeon]|nr:GHMP kinase [archaeon]|tara:strand:- start:915 stop:1946 length:1032 start_codon:yes stop_codon:yes gene_type:complete